MMELEEVTSTYQAIRKSKKIPQTRKISILHTLLYELDLLFFDENPCGTSLEVRAALSLYKEIQRYITTHSCSAKNSSGTPYI